MAHLRWLQGSAARYLLYRLGLRPADTQTTDAERECLLRHAAGRRAIVEIGVMHGVNTGLLRSVMSDEGEIVGIDPHPKGKLGISFERRVALGELRRHRRGTARLLRQLSHEAAAEWGNRPIDFLFIDGDHSWRGIERDWHDWSPRIEAGGLVALHDSRSVANRPDLDSVRFTQEVILADPRFHQIDAADSLTVVQRVAERVTERVVASTAEGAE